MQDPRAAPATGSRDEPYVRDVTYPSNYVFEQQPALLSYVAALGGFAPPRPEGAFVYGEFGCGPGVTLNALAATNPEARFVGVDFNAEHVEWARATAREFGLDNVEYIEASFADLAADDLPVLDYMISQGTYTWLDPALTERLVALAAARLRPGGLFYVHTVTLPGKATIPSLWALMRLLVRGQAGLSSNRAQMGLERLEALVEAKLPFFAASPHAAFVVRECAELVRHDPLQLDEIAHHTLTDHWLPRYFTQLAAELAPAGLRFAASALPKTNEPDLVIPQALRPIFDGIRDPARRELVKDYIINQQQRRDVFVRADAHDAAAAERYLYEHVRAIPRVSPDLIRERLPDSRRLDQVEDALLDALAGGPFTLAEVAGTPALAPHARPQLVRALRMLLAVDALVICARAPAWEPTDLARARRLAIPLAANRVTLARSRDEGRLATMVSVAAGGGCMQLNAVEVSLLWAIIDGANDDRAVASTVEHLRTQGHSFDVDGKRAEPSSVSPEPVRRVLDNFRRHRLPILARLGVVAEAES